MKENRVLIRQLFNEQYTTIIEMESKMVNSHMTSKTQLRHDFTVINCNEDEIECRLVLLDIFLDESNNDLVKEIAQVTVAFNRMFSELHLKLSQKGEILEVLNIDLILSKWEQTKKEMQEVTDSNSELKKIIAVNDSLFTNPEKLKTAISANEFIFIYFGHYFNQKLPILKKKIFGKNLFATANMQWDFDIKSNIPLNKDLTQVTIGSRSQNTKSFSVGFNNAAYGQFKDQIDIHTLHPKLTEFSEHQLHYPTGKLQKATVDKEEIANEKELYMKLKYTLTSDSEKAKKPSSKKMSFVVEDDEAKKGYGIFMDEKPGRKL